MSNLWGLLGYDVVAEQISQVLSQGDEIAIIEGPSGIGKTWLGRDIGVLWETSGGSTVLVEGDLLKGAVPLYPFAHAMAPLPRMWKSVGPAILGIARAGETLLGSGGFLVTAVKTLEASAKRFRGPTLVLEAAEQNVVYELDRLGNSRPILLIADNLHWWDVHSLTLLKSLRDAEMRAAFPFLNQLRILAVQTPEPYQSVTNPEAYDALLKPSEITSFPLKRVPRQGFELILEALGSPGVPSSELADEIYSISGGHLALARRCADSLLSGKLATELDRTDHDDVMRKLVTERIRALGTSGEQAVALLQVAAVIGSRFHRDEVACAFGADDGETSRLLRYCRDQDVLDLFDDIGAFVHDLFREYFLGLDADKNVGVHEKLAECFRRLRPAEYHLRCVNAIDAERPGDAGALGVQAGLQGERDGRSWRQLPAVILEAIAQAGLSDVMVVFKTALDHLNGYRFDACLDALDELPTTMAKRLVAEADYLRAMCLMSTRSEDDRARGRSTLERWREYHREEPEVGIRMMQLLFYGLCHLIDKRKAWALEGEIQQALLDRPQFDVSASDAAHTLDRCSGSLFQPDQSLRRNRRAVRYFGPDTGRSVIRRPVEYYRALVNLGSSEVCNSLYAEACDTYERVESLVRGFAAGSFPRVDYPRMNKLLAEFRMGAVDAREAIARQQAIVSSAVDGDPFFGANAIAVYLVFAGQFDQALAIFDSADRKIVRSRRVPEPNVTYLIRSNRCAARYVSGDFNSTSSEWTELGDLVRLMTYPSREVFIKRHDLLSEVIATGEPTSAEQFDIELLLRHPEEFGPLWQNYGRGFTLPTIEFWREN